MYDGDTELPDDAVDRGYRRDAAKLWLSADHTTAYLATEDHVEAWASTTEQVGCA